MKSVMIEAMFPELKGPNIYKTGRGQGATSKAAINRAFSDLLKQVRGKRFGSLRATISIVDIKGGKLKRPNSATPRSKRDHRLAAAGHTG